MPEEQNQIKLPEEWSRVDVSARMPLMRLLTFKDVQLAIGDVVESRGVDTEVLGQDAFWIPLEQLRNQEGIIF